MHVVAFGAQQVNRPNTNLQMFGNGPFIESVSLSRQLNLAVQRFIGDAQQGAVRNAEAIALGGNGCAFHIDSHRAAEVKAQR
ncbi:Uncharacterised protein [Klebsiella michiganensis]|nr:Uncharacterised protein [Klebsiella michiganensis]